MRCYDNKNKEFGRYDPIVSVITPSFNQGRFIEKTIRSVLEQDYPHIEYIVIDGGSTDKTIDILKRYGDRIKWISEKDRGQSDAINKGIMMAKGEIVAWLNSDDYYLPGAVRKVAEVFQREPCATMVYGSGYRIDENEKWRVPCKVEPFFDLWKLIHLYDYILQPATFMRRSAVLSAGLLDVELYYNLDWDLWIRLAKEGKVVYIPDKLACARVYPEAKTQSGGLRRWKEIIRISKKYGNYRYPPAMFLHVPKGFMRNKRGEFSSSVQKTLSLGRWLLYPLTKGRVSGFYQDGYMSRRGFISLPVVKDAVVLRLEIVPLVSGKVKVLVNNKEKYTFMLNESSGQGINNANENSHGKRTQILYVSSGQDGNNDNTIHREIKEEGLKKGGVVEIKLDNHIKSRDFLHLEFRTLSAKKIPATSLYPYERTVAFQIKDMYYITCDGRTLREPGFLLNLRLS